MDNTARTLSYIQAKPILKWAGGKTQMLNDLLPKVPSSYGRYIEPFFGGGALFFALRPENAIIADSNPELVNMYRQVANNLDDVIDYLKKYKNTSEMFYQVRALEWTELPPAEAAARTIYLNRTCFNGLYRVNRKGQFNVPYGKYVNPKICDEENLHAVSKALQKAEIVCGDYLLVLEHYAKPGDFIFLDPPYLPISEYSDFKRYTKEQFYEEDHVELAKMVMRLHEMGCSVVLTNSNHPLVHELYSPFKIDVIQTKRHISCNGKSRKGEDVIVTVPPKHKTLMKLAPQPLPQQVSCYMAMSATFTKAMIENSHVTLSEREAKELLAKKKESDHFVATTFKDLYYTDAENELIDILRTNIAGIKDSYKRAIAMTALIRACTKKRPRGIFTYTGNRYNDGRKDLQKSLEQQFLEAVEAVNAAVFDNGMSCLSKHGDAMELRADKADLVYMDPPYYSPLSDNEYVRRYHFVEGLARDWKGVEIQEHTQTKKFKSYPTPFSTRKGAADAFDKLFKKFANSILIVSYSSNSLPTQDEMLEIMARYKKHVEVIPVDYKYSFGNQGEAKTHRNSVQEYLFVGY